MSEQDRRRAMLRRIAGQRLDRFFAAWLADLARDAHQIWAKIEQRIGQTTTMRQPEQQQQQKRDDEKQ